MAFAVADKMSLNRIRNYYIFFTLFLSGAVILIIEIAGSRILAPFYGSTVFVWSSLITVTLGFLALGYFIGGFFADKYPRPQCFYFVIFLGAASALFLIKFNQYLLVFSDKFSFKFGPLVAGLALFAIPVFLLSMAGPYAIRLCSRIPEYAGHVSGIIFGVSTLGSLFGALLAGFYLLPNFFLRTIFSVFLAVLMVAAIIGLILEKSSRRMIAVSIFLLILLLLLPFFNTLKTDFSAAVIYHEPSFYGEIRVVEHLGQRCLEVNSSSQTCVSQKNGVQILSYGRLIASLLVAGGRNGDLLIVGLGGGILARDLKEKFKTVDSVEIDPKMVFTAKEFFGYNDSGSNTNTYIDDARNFIRKSVKKYDVIIVDAFSGANPVPHLYTRESFEEMKNILAPDGMLLVNSLGRPHGEGEILPQSVYKTLSSIFPYCKALSTENIKKDPEALGNIIFAASFKPEDFVIRDEFMVDYGKLTDEAEILTDGKNPIEIFSAASAGEVQKKYQQFLSSGPAKTTPVF